MKPIKTQIEELEREIEDIKVITINDNCLNCNNSWKFRLLDKKVAKLQTLKECKKMFDDYNKKLKEYIRQRYTATFEVTNKEINNLSKEVLGE